MLVFLASPHLPGEANRGWVRAAGVLSESDPLVKWHERRDEDGGDDDDDDGNEEEKEMWDVVVCTVDDAGYTMPLLFCHNPDLWKKLASKRCALNLSLLDALHCGRCRRASAYGVDHRRRRHRHRGRPRSRGTEFDVDGWDSAFVANSAVSGIALPAENMLVVGHLLAANRTHRLRRQLASMQPSSVSVTPPPPPPSSLRDDLFDDGVVGRLSLLPPPPPHPPPPRTTAASRSEWTALAEEFARLKRKNTYSVCRIRRREGDGSQPSKRWYTFSCKAFYRTASLVYPDEKTRPGFQRVVMRFAAGLPPPGLPRFDDWQRFLATPLPPPPSSRRDDGGGAFAVLQYAGADGRHSFVVCNSPALETLVEERRRDATHSEVFQAENRLWVTAVPLDHDEEETTPTTTNGGGGGGRRPRFCLAAWKNQTRDVVTEALIRCWPFLAKLQKMPAEPLVRLKAWISEEMTAQDDDDHHHHRKTSVHAVAVLPSNVAIVEVEALATVWKIVRALVLAQPARFPALASADGRRCFLDCGLTRLRLPGCRKRLRDGRLVRRLIPADGDHSSSSSSSPLDACIHYPHDSPALTSVPCCRLFRRATFRFSEPIANVDANASSSSSSSTAASHSPEEALAAVHRFFGERGMRFVARSNGNGVHFLVPMSSSSSTANRYCCIKGGLHGHPKMYLVFRGGDDCVWIHCHSETCKSKGGGRKRICLTRS